MTARLLWAVALVGVGGFFFAVPSAQIQKPAIEGYPALGSPATVKLISAGQAPLRALRYDVAADHQSAMEMLMSVEVAVTGLSMPALAPTELRIALAAAVTRLDRNGDFSYAMALTKIDAGDAAGNPVARVLQEMLGPIVGAKVTATTTNRGIITSADMDVHKVPSAGIAGNFILMQLSSTLRTLLVVFPEEPVGAGAKWEVRQAFETGGLKQFQKHEFELVSVTGPSLALKVKFEQIGPSQWIGDPKEPGAGFQVNRFAGIGSADAKVRTDSLASTISQDVTTTIQMMMGSTNITFENRSKTSVTAR